MRKRLLKLVVLALVLALPRVGVTNSFFSDQAVLTGNTITAGCWVPPSVPVLVSPADNTFAGLDSGWNRNPIMDWKDSTTTCPLPTTFEYQYESYYDFNLTRLAYRSGWLLNSEIPALNTPEGEYYWQVRARDSHGNVSQFSSVFRLVVDRTAPVVEFTSLSDRDTVSGIVPIRGSVTDANPHHYWLAAKSVSTGEYIAGFPGIVNETSSFTDRLLYSWDTRSLVDGDYVLMLEARDAANNKDPATSVEWITVTVDNPPAPPTGLTIFQGHDPATRTSVGCGGTVNDTKITISWDPNAEPDIDFYWFGTKLNPRHAKVYSPKTEYLGNMTPGRNPYYYTVIAVDKAGNESLISSKCSLVLAESQSSGAGSGEVVINELMWMGSYSASEADSTNDNDEWIELRNMTNAPIDLSGWYLTDRSGTKITIPAGKTISPNGFYVISRFDAANSNIKNEPNQVADNLILDNDHLQIKLYNAGGLLIDTAGDGDAPAAGFWGGASHWSMERNNTPGNGALAGSWHTCIDHASSIYWDVGVEDLGTPGGPNLSENDPSWYSAVTLNSFQNLQGILNQVQGDNISAQDGSNTEESCQPDIQLVLASDKKSVSFEARCIADFQKLNYEIVYDAKPEEKGMAGSIDLRGENSVNRDNLKLGTCSSFGEVCVYDEGMTKINLKVTLFKENGESLELSKMMDY